MDPTAAERPDADLIRTLEGAHYHPLWDRYKRITPIAPRARDEPMHWRWRDFEPRAARPGRGGARGAPSSVSTRRSPARRSPPRT
jgi:gentisate 1,2-dioxygenase